MCERLKPFVNKLIGSYQCGFRTLGIPNWRQATTSWRVYKFQPRTNKTIRRNVLHLLKKTYIYIFLNLNSLNYIRTKFLVQLNLLVKGAEYERKSFTSSAYIKTEEWLITVGRSFIKIYATKFSKFFLQIQAIALDKYH